MLLLLRFTGHKKIANVLSLLATVAGFACAIGAHHHSWLIMSFASLGLSCLQIRHQRREDSAAGSATTRS
jgi:hypothetical protein